MKYKVTLNGTVYEVEVEKGEAILVDEYAAAAPTPAVATSAAPTAAPAPAAPTAAPAPAAPAEAPAPAAASVGEGEVVSAPLPGTIFKIVVSANQAVKKGETLVIIEAMKMENEVVAPRDGIVKQIITTAGATIETGTPLVVLG